MDSSAQNNNQDTVGIDMDAINAAVEASVGQPVAETSFDVDKISLDNTPTTLMGQHLFRLHQRRTQWLILVPMLMPHRKTLSRPKMKTL